jgi:hypothetical protein
VCDNNMDALAGIQLRQPNQTLLQHTTAACWCLTMFVRKQDSMSQCSQVLNTVHNSQSHRPYCKAVMHNSPQVLRWNPPSLSQDADPKSHSGLIRTASKQ